jgi:PAS domain S-box-containing protein
MIIDRRYWLVIAVVAIICTGALLTAFVATQSDRSMREEVLVKAKLAITGFNTSLLSALNGSQSDLDLEEYQKLKAHLSNLPVADPSIRFAYFMGQRPDGLLFFYADSEPPGSKDYSPPGQEYQEASPELIDLFRKEIAATIGPYPDRWGIWVSSLVPINDPASGKFRAVFGIDLDARYWNNRIMADVLIMVTGVAVALLIVLFFFFIIDRNERERKQLENTASLIRESEERYRSVVEDQTEFIFRALPDGTYTFVNNAFCRFFSVERDHLPKLGEISHIPEDQRKSVAAAITTLTPDKPVTQVTHRAIMQDGQESWLNWVIRGIFNENKEIFEIQGVGRDITWQKHIEDTLVLTNQKLNLLSSVTRQDILNQVFALKGFLQLALDYQDNPDKSRGFVENAMVAVNTIENQITFTRNYQELGSKRPSWQSINQVIIQARGGLPMVQYELGFHRPGLQVLADPLLEKVFFNLFDNAIRHGGESMRTIRVSSQETGEGLVIVCENDGNGISEAARKTLFTQGGSNTTGFGLFLSREILSVSNIAIRETSLPGQGARFEIVVPRGGYRFVDADQDTSLE